MNANNIVTYELDASNPLIQGEQLTRLNALAQRPDSEIDYSDIPPSQTDPVWRRVDHLVRTENKQQVTLRLDADVLGFFKATGKRYQSRINAALREYMGTHQALT
jgi:uncharacterized protein (DUF4415 family)